VAALAIGANNTTPKAIIVAENPVVASCAPTRDPADTT
jgi:hypothetical protein